MMDFVEPVPTPSLVPVGAGVSGTPVVAVGEESASSIVVVGTPSFDSDTDVVVTSLFGPAVVVDGTSRTTQTSSLPGPPRAKLATSEFLLPCRHRNLSA